MRPFAASDDLRVSPAYLPDLVNVSLDLLVDGEAGIWHLANRGDVSWFEFAALACTLAKADVGLLVRARSPDILNARRPQYGVLGSSRGMLMPALEGAVAHFVQSRADAAATAAMRAARH